MTMTDGEPVKRIGRYELFGELAHGGMATVHLGRLMGPVGFARTVAIKRLHPQLVKDSSFRDMFVDEARLAARIRHPNVVSIIDVVQLEGELFLVMDFVQGVSLQRLMSQARKQSMDIPVNVAVGVIAGALQGLHAAHEAKGDRGEPLNIVHRDVSPQNIMIAVDGVPRVLDFGIAKAGGRLQNTTEGQVKGKFAYMPPEQVAGEDVGSQADVYAAGVVLWEMLAGRRLFKAATETLLITQVLQGAKESAKQYRPDVPEKLDAIVMKAIAPNPKQRFATARAFALALEDAVPVASAMQTGRWVEEVATDALDQTAMLVQEMESQPSAKMAARSLASSEPPGPTKATVIATRPDAPAPPATTATATANTTTARSRSLAPVVVAILVLAIGAAFFLVMKDRERAAQPTELTAPAPASAPTQAPSATAAAPAESVAPARVETSAALATAEPTASVRRPKHGPPPRGPVKKNTAAPATTAAPRPPAADCDPPYTLDSRGIQRMKPQCL